MKSGPFSPTTLDFVAEHTNDIIVRTNQAGEIIYVSPSIRMFGYEPSSFLGAFRYDLIHPDDREHFIANSQALLRGEIPPLEERQHRLRTAGGDWVWIEGSPGIVSDADGQPLEIINIFRDITRRREAEDQARQQSDLLAATFHNAAIGKVVLDESGRFVRVNRAFCEIVGRSGPELQGMRTADITHPDDAAADAHLISQLRLGELNSFEREKRYLRPDGSVVWAHLAATVVRDARGVARHFMADVEDLTERRTAATALEESEARYFLIAENTSDMFVLSDLDNVITYVSPSVRQTGRRPEDFVGQAQEDLLPDDALGDFVRARAALLEGSPLEIVRWRGRRGSDRTPIWMESRITLLRDDLDGRPTGFLDVVRNIDAQVAQEKALADAVAVKSQFLSNMSHEIRTPLTAVLGFAELLAKRELDEKSRLYVSRISGAGNGLLAIVNDILDFSKLEAGKFVIRPQPTNVAEICDQALHMFTTQAEEKKLALSLHVDPRLAEPLLLDGDRLRQVLINLLGNALKFTDEGGVTLRAGLDADGRNLVLQVEDTGPGLDDAQRAQLFQRFSQVDGSTARRHGGTGLGLAICRGITEAMSGAISVESEPGRRTTFTVAIPAIPAPVSADPDANLQAVSVRGLRILVVDDHALNRELARQMLEAAGAIVREAAGGAEAMHMLARAVFDVVLLDLRMPRIDGREVLRRLRAGRGRNGEVPVIAFTADVDVTAGDPAGFAGLVRKPISAAHLYAVIARACGR